MQQTTFDKSILRGIRIKLQHRHLDELLTTHIPLKRCMSDATTRFNVHLDK